MVKKTAASTCQRSKPTF